MTLQVLCCPAGGKSLYGLYDTDGVLRFICADKEACLAYAELFELPQPEYSLMALAENVIHEKRI